MQKRSPTVTLFLRTLLLPTVEFVAAACRKSLAPGEPPPRSNPLCAAAAFSARALRRRLERRDRLEGVAGSVPCSSTLPGSSCSSSSSSSSPIVSSAHLIGEARQGFSRGVKPPWEEETSERDGSESGVAVDEVRQDALVNAWQRPNQAAADFPSANVA